ncbi:hypothetical protein [Streptomyces sp. NPDC001970]
MVDDDEPSTCGVQGHPTPRPRSQHQDPEAIVTSNQLSPQSTGQVWRKQADVPVDWTGCVLTMGVFDGFHRGHTKLVSRTCQHAARTGLPSVLLTFDPHPLTVICPDRAPRMLLTIRERITLAHHLGIDVVFVLPFTDLLAHTTAEEFASKDIAERLRASVVVVGDNFRFGKGGRGDVDTLKRTGARNGFTVEAVGAVEYDGQTCSSTLVRNHLDIGDRASAEKLLGRPVTWETPA